MTIQLITITAPASEPVSTAEAKTHLRVGHSSDDTYIDALVSTARQVIEARTGMRLFTQTVELRADSFDELGLGHVSYPPTAGYRSTGNWYSSDNDVISLRCAPVQSVDSVKYYSSSNVDSTFSSDDYWTDLVSVPCRIQVTSSDVWPTTNNRIGNVRIRMTAGWSDTADIPEIFKTAIKLLVGHYYENREQVTDVRLMEIPEGIQNIIMNNPEFHHYQTGSM